MFSARISIRRSRLTSTVSHLQTLKVLLPYPADDDTIVGPRTECGVFEA
jgi:hypothetical protein